MGLFENGITIKNSTDDSKMMHRPGAVSVNGAGKPRFWDRDRLPWFVNAGSPYGVCLKIGHTLACPTQMATFIGIVMIDDD